MEVQTTTTYSGTGYRCIPSSSSTPLATEYSVTYGGRWNSPGSYPVMYTFLSPQLARQWVSTNLSPYTVDEVQPERLPDLLVLELELDNMADLASTTGLEEVGLPSTYPIGYTTTSAWTVTQTVGATIHDAGHTSILTRSATATQWTGQVETWAEIAIFTDQAPKPALTERIPYGDWL
jgi:RES domain-containing protein